MYERQAKARRYPNGRRGRISGQDRRQIVSRAKVAPHSLLREVGKRAKLRERLGTARIVEHQTRHFDGVFIESGFHLAVLDVAHRQRNRQPGKTDSAQNGAQAHLDIVDDERSVDGDPDRLSVLDEVPVEDAARRAPQLNAVELLKLSRAGRSAALADIGCGRNDGEAYARRHWYGDHIRRNQSRHSNPGIETLLDNIDEAVVTAELQLNIRISFEKIRQHPVSQQRQVRAREIDAEAAAGGLSPAAPSNPSGSITVAGRA